MKPIIYKSQVALAFLIAKYNQLTVQIGTVVNVSVTVTVLSFML